MKEFVRSRRLKRAFDVAASATTLLLVSPVMATAAGCIRLSMGSPVLFRQRRPGLNGQPFELLKFRTMVQGRADAGVLSDEERLTPLGRLLRATSIDELPQLWNVLRGDMSLVGPRPLLMQYLARYDQTQARRHEVPPGITGWAQVNGRNDISWNEKFGLDVWYVDNWSVGLDFRILAMTVGRVLRRKGISKTGHATTTEFMGSAGTP